MLAAKTMASLASPQPWSAWAAMPPLAFSNLELGLMAAVLLLSLVCGGLWLRQAALQQLLAAEAAVVVEAIEEPKAIAAEEPSRVEARSHAQAQMQALERERDDLREEAELILLQLHQVQEELEHYFLLSRSQQELLERCQVQLERSKSLLLHFHGKLEETLRQQRRGRDVLGRSYRLLKQTSGRFPAPSTVLQRRSAPAPQLASLD